jgi:predicted RNA binding protein YcfA (HicA-like mRNA interferase family)
VKIPRDLSGDDLIKKVQRLGYIIVRQKGSHIRLSKKYDDVEHPITIPNHNPIKIGTLNSILSDLSEKMKISKSELVQKLFE